MKFEFVAETDQLLNDTIYFTKQDGVFISGTISSKKEVAYAIFEKLSQGLPLRTTEVLETKNYQKTSQE
jgi:phenylalanine-4-hydroxylase